MFNFYSQNNDFIHKDISLSGGTIITLYEKIDINKLQTDLSGKLDDISVREITDLITREQKAVIVETKTPGNEAKLILEDYLGYNLTDENSSFEFTGSTLSNAFYNQLLIAIIFSFILMAIVVFIIFRTFVPSTTVIGCVFVDILFTLVVVDMLDIKISAAGIVAFLMLIGYSVDTDILLTNRILKRTEGTLNQRILGAFKTGMTMTLTSIVAVIAAFLITKSISDSLSQIFTIISIGLSFDIFNTWLTNVSILKWYIEHKEAKK
jgi:preprotein translocase subunit SecF